MNKERSILLLTGISVAMVLLYFLPSAKFHPRRKAAPPVVANPTVAPAEVVRKKFNPDFSSTALAKIDPLLLDQMREHLSFPNLLPSSSDFSAMVVLTISENLQESLANAFAQNPEESSAHAFEDRSPTRGLTALPLEEAYAKRKLALDQQVRLLDDVFEEFLTENRGLTKRNIETRLRLAPMVSIKASPQQILDLAESDAVRHIGADLPGEKAIERVAAEARFSHARNADFMDGTGVKLAILEEYDTPLTSLLGTGKPIKSPVAIYDPDNVTEHEHSSNVAAVIWGQDSFFRGLALGSRPYFATAETTTGRAAATDWCIQQGCSVISMSWGSPAGTNNGNLKWFDLYYDWVTEINRVLIVAAAGNDGNEAGRVIHPGAAFNVLTVGALDGKNPNTWSDDVIASFSNHVDPNTGTMKPEVVSYGTNIKAAGVAPAFSQTSSGTSLATPAVSAAAALCIQENPNSANEPMLLKAQLMASGVSHDLAGTDHDGVGTVLAQAYNAATSARSISRTGSNNLEWTISLAEGRKNRIVLCYPHRPKTVSTPNSGTAVDNGNSYHQIDFDLELWVGGQKVAQSDFGPNNPFEVIDYTPASSTSATVRIVRYDWKATDPRDTVRVGLAYGSNLNFGTGPDDSNDDSYEPNDSAGEAKSLPLQTSLTEMRSTDEDWFRIDLPPYTSTTVRINFEDDIGNLNLIASRLDNSSIIVASQTENDFESVTLNSGGTAQSWLVKVVPSLAVRDRTSYELNVQSDLPLTAPVPIYPLSNQETTTTPLITCGPATNSQGDSNPQPHSSTHWQVADTTNFTNPRLDQTTSSPTELTVPGGRLEEERNYYWRARHIDQAGRASLWSQPILFETKATPVFTPLSLEGRTEKWVGNGLLLDWDPAPSTEIYRIYKREVGSNDRGVEIGTSGTSEFLFKDLTAGDRYLYSISATQNGVEGESVEITLTSPPAQADGLIGTRASRLRGNNRYNTSGKGQRVNMNFRPNGRAVFYIAVENDSTIQSDLHFRMQHKKRHLKVQVKTQDGLPQNVTAALILNGYVTPSVPAKSMVRLVAKASLKRATGPLNHTLRFTNSAISDSSILSSDVTLSRIRRK